MRVMRVAVLAGFFLLLTNLTQAQITIGGKFETAIDILPAVQLTKASLTLTVGVQGWSLSSVSAFNATGFYHQSFTLTGTFGPVKFSGEMAFNPSQSDPIVVYFPEDCPTQSASVPITPPDYKWAFFETTFDIFGASLIGRIEHWNYPYIPVWAEPYYKEEMWPCCEPEEIPASYMLYSFSFRAPPFYLDLRFADCCTGITFSDLSLGFDDLGLCCGVTFDLKFYFTKAGFQYALIEIQNIPFVCCGFGLDFAIKFTVSGKEVTVRPKWVGVGQLCFQLYGDVIMDGASVVGFNLYGYKIRCDLGPCNYVEFLTVLGPDVVDEVEEIIGDVFEDDETEYIKFSICGEGCCGSQYTVEATVFFSETGSLFGFSRVVVDMSVPLLANFAFTSSFTLPSSGDPSMNMGFVFSF